MTEDYSRLSNKWTLWFHRVDESDFSEPTFQKIYEIEDIETFWRVIQNIPGNVPVEENVNVIENLSEESDKKSSEDSDSTKQTENIEQYTSGLFYLMREDIKPMLEDSSNFCHWTYRIADYLSNQALIDMFVALVSNNLTRTPENMQYINGVSISPKIKNCILKIWINDPSFEPERNIVTQINETKLVKGQYAKCKDKLSGTRYRK